MIKTRIAGTAALVTFGLAALGGTALAVAAPSSAAFVELQCASSCHIRNHAAPGKPRTTTTPGNATATSKVGSAPAPGPTSSNNGPISKVGSAPTSNVSGRWTPGDPVEDPNNRGVLDPRSGPS